MNDNVSMTTVLIIERDADLRRLYAAVVRGLGFEAAFHEGGEVPPIADVVLVEPVQHESLRIAVRVRERQPDVPIVCASVREPTHSSAALRPVRHLRKPFGLAELTDAISAAGAAGSEERDQSAMRGADGEPPCVSPAAR